VEVVASLSQGRTAAAQCGLSTHKSVPVIFEPPCRRSEVFKVCWCSREGSVYWELVNSQFDKGFSYFKLAFHRSNICNRIESRMC